jgi:glutamine amidotransferase
MYKKKLLVIDYGIGNLGSIINVLNFLNVNFTISGNKNDIEKADTLLLPGVGSFQVAMRTLKERDLYEEIIEAVKEKHKKILGICLGFQLMCESSTENGETNGFGFIPGKIERFSNEETKGLNIPHIGYNSIRRDSSNKLFKGLKNNIDFYFDHSYRLVSELHDGEIAFCHYGVDFIAAYQKDNIFGAQFHPEKSQTNGLIFMKNFLSN